MTSQPSTRATEVDASGIPEADGIPAFHREPDVVLYHSHAVDVLARLPEESVHCVVTSPPCWRLREDSNNTSSGPDPLSTALFTGGDRVANTGHAGDATSDDGQDRREATATAYVERLREVFTRLARVLVADGTVWLNLGNNLLGMPWQVAFALQHDGWIVRNAAVWHQPNATPSRVVGRLACRYEWLFLLTRQQRYFFDLDPIRVPYTGDRPLSRRTHRGGRKPNTARGSWPPPVPHGQPVPGRNPGDVWTIASRSHPHRRPAFPINLPLRAISAGCPPHGVVLDPFTGSGTTLIAARQLRRHAIGIDHEGRYCEITARRLADTAGNRRMTSHGPTSAGLSPADPPPQRPRKDTA